MPLESDPWLIDKDTDKVAKMARSMSQDMGKRFKEEVLRKIYPLKLVDKIDIGLVCTNWAYDILTNLYCDDKLQNRLLRMVRILYIIGVNPDKDELWLDYMALYGISPFSKKIETFAQIAKIAFMGQLEKPTELKRSVKDVRW